MYSQFHEYAVSKLLQQTDLKLKNWDLRVNEENYHHTEVWQMLLSDGRLDIGIDDWIYCMVSTLSEIWITYRDRRILHRNEFSLVDRRSSHHWTKFTLDPAFSRLFHIIVDNPFN